MFQQFTESLEAKWYREQSIKVHRKRLEEIKMRSKSNTRSPSISLSVNWRKIMQEKDKRKEIDRENMILLIKLTDIKNRKFSPEMVISPRSLNFSLRKKEADRINMENYEFVKRFMNKDSILSARKFHDEYQMKQEYKRNISKANLNRKISKLVTYDGRPGLLPPIDKNLIEITGRKNSVNVSKLASIISNPSGISLYDEKDSEKKVNKSVEIDKKYNHPSLNIDDHDSDRKNEEFEEEINKKKDEIENMVPKTDENEAAEKKLQEIDDEVNYEAEWEEEVPPANEENNFL